MSPNNKNIKLVILLLPKFNPRYYIYYSTIEFCKTLTTINNFKGMQGPPTYGAEPNGLPLSEKLFPEYFRELGYTTRAIGKWHLGFFKRAYTPTRRGFDSHFGYYTGYVSYYDYILQDVVS